MIVENKIMGNLQLEGLPGSNSRAQTASTGTRVPIWRKTRAQKVDEKIESLFESYKLVDMALAKGEKIS